jgi:hypothetical protein
MAPTQLATLDEENLPCVYQKVPATKATCMYTSEYTTDIERMGMS